MITLGTGLGSGIFSNNALIYGANTLAGELGHIIIDENSNRKCGCGRYGCLESYCSAKGMQLTAEELLRESKEKSLLSEQNTITPLSIWEAAKKNDAIALQVFDKTAKILALALANAVCITNPQAIIIGGGIAQSGDYLFSPLKHYFSKYLLHVYQNTVEIKKSNLQHKEAGILGAIALLK
jgi:glucokinase